MLLPIFKLFVNHLDIFAKNKANVYKKTNYKSISNSPANLIFEIRII